MPCYYTGSAEGDAALAHKETQAKLTLMTRCFCDAMSALTSSGLEANVSESTRKVWSEHQKVDAKRKRKR